jgi:hypothetical protein
MSSFSRPIATPARITRSIAITALMGAAMLATPLTLARADDAAAQPAQSAAAPPQTTADATAARADTVEERITSLHSALQITPKEDAKWNHVAQAMRENAAAMQKLAAEKTTEAPQSMTAVEDLNAYQKFAQAHVDGLKNLSSSFETLYNSMPAAQKKVADQVFQNFNRKRASAHS